MIKQLLLQVRENDFTADAGTLREISLQMTKSYQRIFWQKHIGNSIASGFVLGLADFACLGWKPYDLSGYPYEDEAAALYSDWVTLGQDITKAKEIIDKQVE